MSAYAAAHYNAGNYFVSRPQYPKELFDYIKEKADATSLGLCIEIGCGPGEATFELAKIFRRVVAIDPSQAMIVQAKERARELGITNVEFIVGTEKEINHKIHGQADTIVCANAAHWIENIDSFWKKAHDKLSSGGVVAIWGYVDPVFPNQAATDMYLDVMYNVNNKKGLAHYWEQPARDKLRSLFKGMDPPKSLFAYTTRIEGPSDTAEGHMITISQSKSIPELINYLKTYSAYTRWTEANNAHLSKTSLAHGYTERGVEGDEPHADVVVDLVRRMGRASGWTSESTIVLEWKSVFLLGVKK